MELLQNLDADSYDRSFSDGELFRRMRPFLAGQSKRFVLVVVSIVLAAVAGATFPILLSVGVDRLLTDDGGLAWLVVAIVVSAAVAWAAGYFQQTLSAAMVGQIGRDLRTRLFASVLRLDMAFFDQHTTGGVASRVTADTQAFATVAFLAFDLAAQALLITIMLVVLALVSIELAVVTVTLAGSIVLVSLLFRRISRHVSRHQQRALARITAYVQETLRGISVAKNFRQEQATYDGLLTVNEQWYRANVRMNRLFSGIFPILLTLTGLGTVLLVLAGGQAVADGRITPGQWFLFLETVALFWYPLTRLSSFWSHLQQGLAAAERIIALMEARPTVRQTDSVEVVPLRGRYVLRDVRMAYEPATPVLDRFDLDIDAGETVALVGATGAGKTSVVRLLARSYEFEHGSVGVDGHDLRSLDLASYRGQIGIVPQTPLLFTGTVAENIARGARDATREEVEAAAAAIADGDWVRLLPNGLDTHVGEGGGALSRGQRQLVALARVVLQDPAVFMLDEATASIDPLTEALVQEGLEHLAADRTSVIVAHRLLTVQRADRIVVMDGGAIVEQGSHAQLLAAGGAYRTLYDTYFRYQRPDAPITPSGDGVVRR